MSTADDEGVIKFQCDHGGSAGDLRRHGQVIAELRAWRLVMKQLAVLGCDSSRYGGAGFGNLSARVGPPSAPLGRRQMIVSASQTGRLDDVGIEHFCLIERYDIDRNQVVSRGHDLPSSESLTHAALYDLGPHIRAVLHGHAPQLWHKARALRLPQTRPEVPYGTREMAREMARVHRETTFAEVGVLAMAGHEDGIVAVGRSLDEAGQRLVTWLARAYAA